MASEINRSSCSWSTGMQQILQHCAWPVIAPWGIQFELCRARGTATLFCMYGATFQWTNLELCDVCVHGILFCMHFWLSTIGHYLVTRALNRALNGVFGGDARGTKSKKNEHYWDMPSVCVRVCMCVRVCVCLLDNKTATARTGVEFKTGLCYWDFTLCLWAEWQLTEWNQHGESNSQVNMHPACITVATLVASLPLPMMSSAGPPKQRVAELISQTAHKDKSHARSVHQYSCCSQK